MRHQFNELGELSCNDLHLQDKGYLLVETRRIELPTFALRTRRSPS